MLTAVKLACYWEILAALCHYCAISSLIALAVYPPSLVVDASHTQWSAHKPSNHFISVKWNDWMGLEACNSPKKTTHRYVCLFVFFFCKGIYWLLLERFATHITKKILTNRSFDKILFDNDAKMILNYTHISNRKTASQTKWPNNTRQVRVGSFSTHSKPLKFVLTL